MLIKKVLLSQLKTWEKNPRAINKEDYQRLKKQINDLGIYKPLIAYKEGSISHKDDSSDRYIVLGGNMRLRAFQELDIQDVDISIIEPKTEADKLKYALSDNDRAGYYIEEELQELVYNFKNDINLEDYKIDLSNAINLNELISQPTFEPVSEEDQSKLDEKNRIKCPECGHEFET